MTILPKSDEPWVHRPPKASHCGPGYEGFVNALRDLQDAAAMISAPDEDLAAWETQVRELSRSLAGRRTSEWRRSAGQCDQLPGRGHSLLPELHIDQLDAALLRGRVTFREFLLGGNGAAHGGAVAMFFDEAVGTYVNHQRRDPDDPLPHRTAYLNTNYRAITPIGVELTVECSVDEVEGRKCFASGRLYHGEDMVADAVGLFVKLRPGMP